MICDNCGKRQATVHRVEIVNGQRYERHLCGECAKKAFSAIGIFGIGDIINALTSSEQTVEPKDDLVCPVCGTKHSDFLNSGIVGCENCYKVFWDDISRFLIRTQGATQHISQKAAIANGEDLESQLKEAVEKEEYELAAVLRDRIKARNEAENGCK